MDLTCPGCEVPLVGTGVFCSSDCLRLFGRGMIALSRLLPTVVPDRSEDRDVLCLECWSVLDSFRDFCDDWCSQRYYAKDANRQPDLWLALNVPGGAP